MYTVTDISEINRFEGCKHTGQHKAESPVGFQSISYKYETRGTDLGPKWVRLAPNGTNLDFVNIRAPK